MRILFLTLFCVLSFNLSAQVTGKFDQTDIMKEEFENKMSGQELLKETAMPTGNTVNPDFYYLGPGDILQIRAVPMFNNERPVMVSPDNKILLPRSGGMIDVTDKTLTEIREEISEKYKSVKDDAEVFVSFHKPKVCLVTVEGNVLSPSTYTVPGSYRISTLIEIANKKPTAKESPNKGEDYFIQQRLRDKRDFGFLGGNISKAKQNYWRRNILIMHEDGTSDIADLEKADIKGHYADDPYIRQGDRVIVPFPKEDFPVISVSGAVNRPISTVYKKGDKASDLLKFSYGLLSSADKDDIYLFDRGKKIKLNVTEDLELEGKDYELHPGAMIIVGKKSEQTNDVDGVVTVRGRVENEGSYPILNNKTTLSEAIEMAGGLKDNAYLPLAKLYRNDADLEVLRSSRIEAVKLFRKSELTLEDTLRYFLDIDASEPVVSVDFEKALSSSSYNVYLQNGDEIVIPKHPNKVYIFGRVGNPGFIKFEEGKDVEYYLNRAGGASESATEDRIAVIHQQNDKWEEGLDQKVLDGDMIYVPGEKDLTVAAEQAKTSATISLISAAIGIATFAVQFMILLESRK